MQNKYATLREKNLKMRKCRQLWWLARRASDWQKYLGKSSHVHTPPRPCLLALGRWMNCCWRGEICLFHTKCLATHLAISRILFVRKWLNDESPLSLGPFQGPLLHLFPSSSSPSFSHLFPREKQGKEVRVSAILTNRVSLCLPLLCCQSGVIASFRHHKDTLADLICISPSFLLISRQSGAKRHKYRGASRPSFLSLQTQNQLLRRLIAWSSWHPIALALSDIVPHPGTRA